MASFRAAQLLGAATTLFRLLFFQKILTLSADDHTMANRFLLGMKTHLF
jgi:hypothetical protein